MVFSEEDFPAEGIEHNFAYFLGHQIGERGHTFDADVFRVGDPKRLAAVVEATAENLEERASRIKFSSAEGQPGGAKARVEVVVNRLRGVASEMKKSAKLEPNDYHWILVSELLDALRSLLDHYEQGTK